MPIPTPIPMPILLPLLSAPSPVAEEVLDTMVVHSGLPVSSAKTQPLIWTADTVVVVLVVSELAPHRWALFFV